MNSKKPLQLITQLFLVFILLSNQMNAEFNFTVGPTIANFIGADTIDNFEPDCGSTTATFEIMADDDCSNPSLLEYAWEFSTGLSGTGKSASGAFLNGNYSLTFTINDQCGNSIVHIHDFVVKDAKLPTPVCIVGILTAVVPSSGAITIWAVDFESGSSSDNCTAYDDLKFSFSPDVNLINLTIDCDDISTDGLVPISLYVTDEEGNQDYCSTLVNIQDPYGICCCSYPMVTGTIENENQEVIEEVTVSLNTGGGLNPPPIITGANGVYSFNFWPTEGYIVTPKKDINYLNGVTTYDLVLISKHILGTQLLDSPYKIIAADANNSKSITALDLVRLRALILHIDDELDDNESWRFVNANYVFPNPNNPWQEEFPEIHEIVNYGGIYEPGNFVALKIGDVNGTASPNSLLGSDIRTFDGAVTLTLTHLQKEKIAIGETFTIDFRANDFKNIEGFQFTFGFEKEAVEFVDVMPKLEGLSIENFGLTKLNEGKIMTSWNSSKGIDLKKNTVLFSMTFKAKSMREIADIFEINSDYSTAEAYSETNVYEVELSNDIKRNKIFTNVFELYQNFPNPFKEETVINFYLPKPEAVTLIIYDMSGRVLNQMELEGVEGFNSKRIKREDFDATGVLYYQLETATEIATKKMILID
ncbi:MAG: T9SS type A sorting domain-containing protein [Saprospiraceae bacterium]